MRFHLRSWNHSCYCSILCRSRALRHAADEHLVLSYDRAAWLLYGEMRPRYYCSRAQDRRDSVQPSWMRWMAGWVDDGWCMGGWVDGAHRWGYRAVQTNRDATTTTVCCTRCPSIYLLVVCPYHFNTALLTCAAVVETIQSMDPPALSPSYGLRCYNQKCLFFHISGILCCKRHHHSACLYVFLLEANLFAPGSIRRPANKATQGTRK